MVKSFYCLPSNPPNIFRVVSSFFGEIWSNSLNRFCSCCWGQVCMCVCFSLKWCNPASSTTIFSRSVYNFHHFLEMFNSGFIIIHQEFRHFHWRCHEKLMDLPGEYVASQSAMMVPWWWVFEKHFNGWEAAKNWGKYFQKYPSIIGDHFRLQGHIQNYRS